MKEKVLFVLKILVLVIVIGWMALFVTDYFRAKAGSKPMICFSEVNKTTADGTFYKCNSVGYKYYEYIDKTRGQSTYGFGAIFIKSDIEKEIGE